MIDTRGKCIACNDTRISSAGGLCHACTPAEGLRPDISPHLLAFGDQQTEMVTANQILTMLRSVPVETIEQYQQAGEWLKNAKGLSNALETKRKAITQPLLQAKRELDGWIRPIVNVYQEAEKILKQKMMAFQTEQVRQRQIIAAQMRTQHEQGDIAGVMGLAAQAQATTVTPKVEGVSTRKVWRYRVVDLNAVPREYLSVNDQAVKLAMSNGIQVPGIEYYQEETLAVRTT